LHQIEAQFGRIRGITGAARPLDLDLLAYHGVLRPNGPAPVLPIRACTNELFVLFPLRDLAPDWIHPTLGESAADLARRLPLDHDIRQASGFLEPRGNYA